MNDAALAALAALKTWTRAKDVRRLTGAATLADAIGELERLVAAGIVEVRATDRGPVHAFAREVIPGPRVYRLAPLHPTGKVGIRADGLRVEECDAIGPDGRPTGARVWRSNDGQIFAE